MSNDLRATLAQVRAALAQARRDAEREARAQRLQAEREAQERNLFAHSVGTVTPLRDPGRALAARPRPRAEPRQRQLDDAAVLHEALSDGVDIESLLETDDELSFCRAELGPDVPRRLRRGQWSVQATLDLHGLRRDAARERLAAFIHEARRQGWRCVRIIHGKGLGSPGRVPVLKNKVRHWLAQSDAVLAFVQARGDDGGHGALLVLLASTNGRRPDGSPPRAPRRLAPHPHPRPEEPAR